MYQYKLYGQIISSSLQFPQLIIECEKRECDILIEEGGVPQEILQEAGKAYYGISDTISWFQNDTGVFYIAEGKEIHYKLREGANIQYARTYILGYAVSMIMQQKNRMAIHCSAVANKTGAILISGESGAGKSTLTTCYLKKGYKLLADDIVAVDSREDKKVIAYPAFPYQKLCRDTIMKEEIPMNGLIYIDEDKDKFLVPRKEVFMEEPMEVKGMVILRINDGPDIAVEEITGVNKLIWLRENLFLKRLWGDWLTKPTLISQCLQIAGNIPIYVVSRPKDGETREQLMDLLEQIM